MPRRTDEELAAEYERKQDALADRMARKADASINRMRDAAEMLLDLADLEFVGEEDAQAFHHVAGILNGHADERVQVFRRR